MVYRNKNFENVSKYNDIISNFYETIKSLDAYLKNIQKGMRVVNIIDRGGDVRPLELLLNLRVGYSDGIISLEEYEKRLNKIKEDYDRAEMIDEALVEDEKGITSNNPYFARLIHILNTSNNNTKNELLKIQEMTFVNILSIFESSISSLLVLYFSKIHQSTNDIDKRKIQYSDISFVDSKDELKEYFVSDFIKSKMYEKFESWIEFALDKLTKMDKNTLKKEFGQDIEEISVAYIYRNLVLHNQGIVNYESLKSGKINSYNNGDKLEIDEKYIYHIKNILYKLFSIISLQCIKKFKNNDKFSEQFALNNINSIAVEIMNENDYLGSAIIFEQLNIYCNKDLDDNYEFRNFKRIVYYNSLLNSLLLNDESKEDLLKDYDKFLEINKESFESGDLFAEGIFKYKSSNEFDINYLDTIMDEFCDSRSAKINVLLDWPMFKLIENDVDFIEYKEKMLYYRDV